jgi:hypothetical protein
MSNLSSAQVHNYATAFAVFVRRRGGSVADAWPVWIARNSMAPRDAERVRQSAHEILFALGHTTDPPPMAA